MINQNLHNLLTLNGYKRIVDASARSVRALAQAALQAGATKEEIAEALRVACYVCGAGSVYTAAHALTGLY